MDLWSTIIRISTLCALGGRLTRIRTEKQDILSILGVPIPVISPILVVPAGNDPTQLPCQDSTLPLCYGTK